MDNCLPIGLKNIKELADLSSTELRLDAAKKDGTQGYEQYQSFRLVQPEYTLELGTRTGKSYIGKLLSTCTYFVAKENPLETIMCQNHVVIEQLNINERSKSKRQVECGDSTKPSSDEFSYARPQQVLVMISRTRDCYTVFFLYNCSFYLQNNGKMHWFGYY